MLETGALHSEVGTAGFATTAHELVMGAIAKLPGEENYAAGLAELHVATQHPDFSPDSTYDSLVGAGRLLAYGGALDGARRLLHASVAMHSLFPRVLDTQPAAELASAISSRADYPLQDRPHNY